MSIPNWKAGRVAQNEGALAALREWTRLGLSPDDPVDIFRIIADAGATLMFRPLDKVYGFFTRRGQSAWVVVHSGHPLSLQRFTTAHEYGHYVLGHPMSVDAEHEIFGHDVALQELAAQAFAADFLMPLPLVNRALSRLALPAGQHPWTAPEVYQLSLELGVSYRAMLTQLSALHLIRDDKLVELRRQQPSDIKKSLNDGVALINSRADLWTVEPRTRRRWLQLQVDDELSIRVPANQYDVEWVAEWSGTDDAPLALVDDRDKRRPDLPGLAAPPSDGVLHWRAHKVGRGALGLEPRHAGASPPEAFGIEVNVIARGNGPGLHVLQRQRALERAGQEYRRAVGDAPLRWDNGPRE
jgi:Zn-dependent peptidase ImmA (M78 family)